MASFVTAAYGATNRNNKAFMLQAVLILAATGACAPAAERRRMSAGRGSPRKRQRIKQELSLEEHVCWLCLEPLNFGITDWRNPDYVVIDEEIPVSKGGDPLDISNCHLVHNRCNGRKGNRILKKGSFAKGGVSRAQVRPETSRKWL